MIQFEYLNAKVLCAKDEWDGTCCCVCRHHAMVNKHCMHSPHADACCCSEPLGFYVCLFLHELEGGPVGLSADHGICECFERRPEKAEKVKGKHGHADDDSTSRRG